MREEASIRCRHVTTVPGEEAIALPYGEVLGGRCQMCSGLHRFGECPAGADAVCGLSHAVEMPPV